MNKASIEKFAIWARTKLISEITYKAGLVGITEKGIAEPLPQSTGDLQLFDIGTKNYGEVNGAAVKQRGALVEEIKNRARSADYKTAFTAVVEEVAYTWFNRMIAIRFMEVNDYLPSRIRVLSSENPAKAEPDFVTTPFDTDLAFTSYEHDRVLQLKDENKLDELFRMLFIKQCNKLHDILPALFEKTDDYSELLLTISFTDKDGVVYHLTHDINEDDFNVEKEGQVEIIGWMYQYYNTELKADTFARLKKNEKITKERIPSATQLFTPDWIVRYMVENSLGRLWIEGHPNNDLKAGWKYYLDEVKQEESVERELAKIREEYKKLNPEDIKLIDPCMGSGHILVYAFDVLMQIYESCGYTQRDAAKLIVEKNIYGLDIDKRAYQLSYFALMMKARQYDRRFFTRECKSNVHAIVESNDIDSNVIAYFTNNDPKLRNDFETLVDELRDAKEYGSILNVSQVDFDALKSRVEEVRGDFSLLKDMVLNYVEPLIHVAETMAQKYDVVVTNPPYMGASGMSSKLSDFVKKNYPDSKSDMSTVCMERTLQMCKVDGFMSMINIPVWMFLSSYEQLRYIFLTNNILVNMVHPGRGVFGSDFGTTTFVFRKSRITNYIGSYRRLFSIQGEVKSNEEREDALLSGKGKYAAKQSNFSKIPGSPVAYWASKQLFDAFQNYKNLESYAPPKQGLITGDNDCFLRYWHEVSSANTAFEQNPSLKWKPINKGGEFRRWYGNQEYVVNWENEGFEILNFKDEKGKLRSRPQNLSYNFKESLSWSLVTSGGFSVRYFPDCFMFNVAGISCFPTKHLNYILGLLNTKIISNITQILNPTINMNAGDVAKVPVVISNENELNIDRLVDEMKNISQKDWDAFETSWAFKVHPLVYNQNALWEATNVACTLEHFLGIKLTREMPPVEQCYHLWEAECLNRFNQLKANEEELNRIFIDIYGLQEELTPEVEDKDVTVRKADLGRDIRSLISYAVGCMFGRYSLNHEGLAYAGGEWDASQYSTYLPDADNCIPVTDEEYFRDDIVGRFVDFIKTVYGEESLESNLDYIAKALGNRGTTSREVIRNYFLNDFIKDHNKTYQKRPIYWMFDSGKQNGFKALVYMHRWNADTIGNVRVEYLHRMQRVYESEIDRMQETIDNSANSREISAAEKRKDKLQKQYKETKDYDAKIAHLALSRIDIDLDDGVKVNYEKVQTADGKNMGILAAIK